MSETRHQSVRDYIAARSRGDAETASRIKDEVIQRFETRTTDGTEMRDLGEASMTVPLAEPMSSH